MTYEQFLAESIRLQKAYCVDEIVRYEKARELHRQYQADMAALGLHPLDQTEIGDRINQVRGMFARADETHGDTPAQKAIWESRWHDEQPHPPY